MRSLAFGVASVVVLGAASQACAGPGKYVWYNELPGSSADAANEYLISVGDVLSIRVLGHEDMLTRVRVRGDGRIAVPIIGEIVASGRRPSVLRTEIETRLKEFLVLPTVTLNVEEQAPPEKIVVLGEVVRPGLIPVDTASISLAEALALSGGVTEFASRDRIFVVRTAPQLERIRFTWDAVTRDDPSHAGAFPLRKGDLIVVE
jgi:polysaccharide export outer membrane protein